VHTAGRQGQQVKTISLETNDAAAPFSSLTVAFEVRMPVEVWPGQYVGLYGVQGEPTAATIVLRRTDGKPLEVKEATSTDPSVRIEIEKVTEASADKASQSAPQGAPQNPASARPGDVRLVLTTDVTGEVPNTNVPPPGRSGNVKVLTNSPEKPEIVLPLTVQFRPALRTTPDRVGVIRSDAALPGQGQVTILHSSNRTFRATGVTLAGDLPGCTAKVISEQATAAQVVRVDCAGPLPSQGMHQGTLTATTDLEKMPRVDVPVVLRVPLRPAPTVPPPTTPSTAPASAPSRAPSTAPVVPSSAPPTVPGNAAPAPPTAPQSAAAAPPPAP
jgi:hypothetical protein